jgi:hypothetical protein
VAFALRATFGVRVCKPANVLPIAEKTAKKWTIILGALGYRAPVTIDGVFA